MSGRLFNIWVLVLGVSLLLSSGLQATVLVYGAGSGNVSVQGTDGINGEANGYQQVWLAGSYRWFYDDDGQLEKLDLYIQVEVGSSLEVQLVGAYKNDPREEEFVDYWTRLYREDHGCIEGLQSSNQLELDLSNRGYGEGAGSAIDPDCRADIYAVRIEADDLAEALGGEIPEEFKITLDLLVDGHILNLTAGVLVGNPGVLTGDPGSVDSSIGRTSLGAGADNGGCASKISHRDSSSNAILLLMVIALGLLIRRKVVKS